MSSGSRVTSRLVNRSLESAATLGSLLDEHRNLVVLLERSSILQSVATAAREAAGMEMGMVGDRLGDDSFVLRGIVGNWGTSLRDLAIPIGLGLGGKAAALERPTWVKDYVRSRVITHEFDTQVADNEGIRGMVAVPMQFDGNLVAVLYTGMRQAVSVGDRTIGRLQRVAADGVERLHLATRIEEQTQAAVSGERARIAADLHDSVGAMLFTVGAELRNLETEPTLSPEILSRLRWIEGRIARTSSMFRDSLAALDQTRAEGGLHGTLATDCRDMSKRTGIRAHCVALTELPAPCPTTDGSIVRLVREALLNVEKHAEASHVVVSVAAVDGGVSVAVADDGVGISPDAQVEVAGGTEDEEQETQTQANGMGLRAAAARVERLGGSLSVFSNDDGGLTVRAWVPTAA